MDESSYRIYANDVLILFADLQAGIVERAQTIPQERLRKAVRGLAKLAKVFGIPVIVSAIRGTDGSEATIMPEIAEGAGPVRTFYRTTCDSLLNEEILAAVRATGRKTLLLSGVATELAVQLPALTARELGFRVLAVVDACGGVSERTELAAMQRMAAAGVTTVSVMTLAGEMAGDFRDPKAQQAVEILYEMSE